MKFWIRLASDWTDTKRPPVESAFLREGKWFVDVDTTEGLLALCEEVEHNIIVQPVTDWGPALLVYDSYVE